MPIAINERAVKAEPIGPGISRQGLWTGDRAKDPAVLVDRLTLAPGATANLNLAARSLAWWQILDGEARFSNGHVSNQMTDVHSVILTAGFDATLSSDKGVSLLYAELPDAGRIDPGFPPGGPFYWATDWTSEAVFESENDGRKRISLVDPRISETTAIKADLVIYPPGSAGPNHHNEGADAFMYVLNGRGMAWANEQPFPVKKGDLICFPDRERHYVKAADDSEMCFVQFCIPGSFKTVWSEPGKISPWVSKGRDIRHRPAASFANRSSQRRRLY